MLSQGGGGGLGRTPAAGVRAFAGACTAAAALPNATFSWCDSTCFATTDHITEVYDNGPDCRGGKRHCPRPRNMDCSAACSMGGGGGARVQGSKLFHARLLIEAVYKLL
jgi:hypothetical protein